MKSKLSLRDLTSAQERRQFLEKELKIHLENIANFNFTEEQVAGRNIENFIGATQIPLGVAGPLLIHLEGVSLDWFDYAHHRFARDKKAHLRGVEYYIPLATTEGALVASISRGCKAVSESGVSVFVEDVGQTRGPVLRVKNLEHGMKVKGWIQTHLPLLSQITHKTSSHLKLLNIKTSIVGKNLFVRFSYSTSDAMGMNMVTFATEQAVFLIEKKTKAECLSLAGNFDIDKKPAWLNFIEGRGKKVWAEVTLSKKIVKEILKTTPQKVVEIVHRKNHLGSIVSGSLGFNAHFANIAAAIFIATGQDPAHVVEGSLGVTDAESLQNGDLYFSIYLPALVVGTVGGGTHLPTQQEALNLMKVKNVLEFASVIGAAVLAGELSLIASLAERSLAKAHMKLGRSQNSKVKSQR